MTENQARDEICRVGQSLFARGYVHATAGSISVQLDAAGRRAASSIPTAPIAWRLRFGRCPTRDREGERELLPPLTPYFVLKVGRVPVIDYHRPGDAQAAEQVAAPPLPDTVRAAHPYAP